MAGLKQVVEEQGVFCALYSDRGSHFFETPKAGGPVDPRVLTQVGRALKELRIEMIPAYSPQARGRSERNFQTWQGRLPQELRLRGITTLAAANAFLEPRYVAEFNRRFAVPAEQQGSAFLRSGRRNLEWVFSVQHQRTVNRDNTVAWKNRVLQIEKNRWRHTLAGCTVIVHELGNGELAVRYGPHVVGRYDREGRPLLRCGKDGAVENLKAVSHRSLEIPPTPRDSHFPTAPAAALPSPTSNSRARSPRRAA